MVCFVLSGGASLGAVQAGMLRALYEREIAPELIIGASVGAINGAYIASRPPTAQTAQALAEIWRALRTFQIFPPNPVTGLLGLLGRLDHLVPNIGLRRLLAAHLQSERLEDTPIPLHVIATDPRDGQERRLSQGDAGAAVLASASIPGIYPPVEFEGAKLVDGGVGNNTPISHAAALGASRIYVLPTGISCELEEPPRGAIPVLIHAFTVLISQRLADDIECFSHDAELIEQSYELASAALEHPDPAEHWTPQSVERMRPHGR